MTMLGTTILILLGIMLILYGLSIGAIFALSFSSGWWVWLVLAALCLLFAWLFHLSPEEREKLPVPRWIWVVVITTLLYFGALFLYTGAQILAAIPNDEEEDADYLIILGAGIEGTEPGPLLKNRLDEALAYWRDHPTVIFVVSGGMGENESYTESDVMAYYLINHGVLDERIVKETEAQTTVENIRYSAALLPYKGVRARVVTSDFHVFRACQIARKQGLIHAFGLSAPSDPNLLPHYVLREFFAILKDFLMGQM